MWILFGQLLEKIGLILLQHIVTLPGFDLIKT